MTIETNKIYCGEALAELKKLPDESVNCIMTSPPYWALRDYGIDGQLGLETTFQEYIKRLCDIFDEAKRVLRNDGTCWVNLGDTYAGGVNNNDNKKVDGAKTLKPIKSNLTDKNLCNIPSRFSIEMQNRGWILRNVIIWHKPNCMPSSVVDRFTVDFEYIFFFVKSKRYWFETQREGNSHHIIKVSAKMFGGDGLATKQKAARMDRPPIETFGRNKRAVWTITTKPFREAHFAVYPEELCETPIKAGCHVGGIVLDPFFGSGTTGLVALKQNKQFIGIELNPKYIEIAEKRLKPYLTQTKLDDCAVR